VLYGGMGMEMCFAGGGMRKTEQRMGIREHRMMTEHRNEKRRTRNENGGRTEQEWWQNTE
jgi:hypothetical protein